MRKLRFLIGVCFVTVGLTTFWIYGRAGPRATRVAAPQAVGVDELLPSWKVLVKRLANSAEKRNAEVKIVLSEREAILAKEKEKTFRTFIDFDSLEEDRARYLEDWKQNPGRSSIRYVRLERKVGPPPRLDVKVAPFLEGKAMPLPAFADPGLKENKDLHQSSLIITNLGVVEDKRAEGLGPWSFGHLMTQLANKQNTGLPPSEFVSRWLKHWDEDQTINGDSMKARLSLGEKITRQWQESSGAGEPLDLAKAPFRLLAIVNRIDLRKNLVLKNLVLQKERDDEVDAGEARFVFCAVDRKDKDKPLLFTVIFEYAIKKKDFAEVQEWGRQWFNLKDKELGKEEYKSALEKITRQFTEAGVRPQAPNGSALAQLRTNTTFGSWELREFRIDRGSHHLNQVPVTDTPRHDKEPYIPRYLKEHQNALLAERHHIPESSYLTLGGSAITNANKVWKGPEGLLIDFKARRFFSLSTCNGCHAGEGFPWVGESVEVILTDDKNPPPHFTHIRPRFQGKEARLSLYLTGDDGKPLRLTDQVPRHFGGKAETVERFELERRANDLGSLIRYGLVYELQRTHFPAAH